MNRINQNSFNFDYIFSPCTGLLCTINFGGRFFALYHLIRFIFASSVVDKAKKMISSYARSLLHNFEIE